MKDREFGGTTEPIIMPLQQSLQIVWYLGVVCTTVNTMGRVVPSYCPECQYTLTSLI